MKTKIYFFILFLFAGMNALQAQEQQEWEWVCNLVGENLCKVFTQGTDTVYVVGENGLIAKSTNKGLTWNKEYFSSKVTLNDIIFCNHDIGFIVGDNGTILRTRDAGSSWEPMASGTIQNINAIAAFDINNLWIIGDNGLVMYSTDMGETWLAKSFLLDNLFFNDIKCKENRGYIAGIDGQVAAVFNTEDGGLTWKEHTFTEYDAIPFISIADSKVYAIAGNVNSNIIFTEDNINWISPNMWVNGFPAALYFQNDQNGFVSFYAHTTCGDCGMGFWINQTTNGGDTGVETYFQFFSDGNSTRSSFAFSSNNEFGYCVLGKILMRTPYTGDFDDCKNNNGMTSIKLQNPVLTLNQQGDELQVNSNSKMIDRVDIITIEGIKFTQKTERAKAVNINIGNFPKGIYLINTLFSDKTNSITKWIKN